MAPARQKRLLLGDQIVAVIVWTYAPSLSLQRRVGEPEMRRRAREAFQRYGTCRELVPTRTTDRRILLQWTRHVASSASRPLRCPPIRVPESVWVVVVLVVRKWDGDHLCWREDETL